MQRRPWFLACLALACSSSTLEDEPSSGGSGGSAGGAATPVCEAPGYPTAAEKENVGSVEATVLDLDGNPPADLLVQVCGLDVCIGGKTDSSGYAQVGVGSGMILPAFKYGDGLTFAKIALLFDVPVDSLNLGELYLPALPAEGATIAAGTTVSSGGAELTVAEGASVVFDRLTYRTADEQLFRAAELPAALAPEGLGAGQDFELFYALGPIDTELCPPAALSLPNSADFEPGTEVEFYLHGLDGTERYAPYGGFAKIADGVVSEDGSVVSTTDGGVQSLSLVAVKRKP